MRTPPPPGGKLTANWRGKRVRTKEPMQNGMALIPAGKLATVTGVSPGLTLLFDKCGFCGMQLRMSRVDHRHVEIV